MSMIAIKRFLGIQWLNSYEVQLIDTLKINLPECQQAILEDQLSHFNRIHRDLVPKEELKFGHTSFYWVRFGKVRMDFPKKFSTDKDNETLATAVVVSKEDGNIINVSFDLVFGYLFTIKYRSNNKVFVPVGEFEIRSFKFYGDWASRF